MFHFSFFKRNVNISEYESMFKEFNGYRVELGQFIIKSILTLLRVN